MTEKTPSLNSGRNVVPNVDARARLAPVAIAATRITMKPSRTAFFRSGSYIAFSFRRIHGSPWWPPTGLSRAKRGVTSTAKRGPTATGVPIKVVKLGGSVITDKRSETPAPRTDVLNRLAREVVEAGGETIVLHGAGSFGHPGARKYRLREGLQGPDAAKGAAEVRASVGALNALVIEALREAGGPAGRS